MRNWNGNYLQRVQLKMAGKFAVAFLFATVVATLLVKPAASDEITKAKLEVSARIMFKGRIRL